METSKISVNLNTSILKYKSAIYFGYFIRKLKSLFFVGVSNSFFKFTLVEGGSDYSFVI